MEPLLYLVHRIPFPPNKGDKIRSYHLLRHLARTVRGALWARSSTRQETKPICTTAPVACAPRTTLRRSELAPARLRSVSGFLTGEALTLPYYRSSALQSWVRARRCAAADSQGDRVLGSDGAVRAGPARTAVGARLRGRGLGEVGSNTRSGTAGQRPIVYRREGEKLFDFERGSGSGAAPPTCFRYARGSRSLPAARAGVRAPCPRRSERRQYRLLRAACGADIALCGKRSPRSFSPARWTTGRTSTRSPGSLPRYCRTSSRSSRTRASTSWG